MKTLTEKQHIGQLVEPGDFCFVEDQPFAPRDRERLAKCSDEELAAVHLTRDQLRPKTFVIMACPVCAGLFVCKHEIKNKRPLTLSPSVVGPTETWRVTDQILAPCHHHFFVANGEIIDAR